MPTSAPRAAATRPSRGTGRSLGRRGSSLIELLLAAALLGVALLAVAPLFVRAAVDLAAGEARSTAALLAQNALEGWSAVQVGRLETRVEYYSVGLGRWLDSPPPVPDLTRWVRETRIERYPLAAVTDGRLDRSEALPADSTAPGVDLLAVRVTLSRRAGGRPIARLERLEWSSR